MKTIDILIPAFLGFILGFCICRIVFREPIDMYKFYDGFKDLTISHSYPEEIVHTKFGYVKEK